MDTRQSLPRTVAATANVTPRRHADRGFTLVELLMAMAITTVILGAVMATMTDAVRATESATQVTNLNNGLRTAMDLMVRDMLQVGQGLPSGRSILVPNGTGSWPILLPGPEGSELYLSGPSFCPPAPPDDNDTVCEQIQAVIPGPGRGPTLVDGQPPTDMITTLAADSAFDSVALTAFAANGSSITVATPAQHVSGVSVATVDIQPGDLIMLTKGSASALRMVSGVSGQTINLAPGDALGLNQSAAADGTAGELRNTDPVDTLTRPPCAPSPAPCTVVTSVATRIRMITYYIDNVTDPERPRLVRRLNNSTRPAKWNEFDNSQGTAVAFDIEGLYITYDLADDRNFYSNVRMDDDDLTDGCDGSPCYPSQIRKINITIGGRSRLPRRGTQQFFRNQLTTQVSLRSLAFVDRYR